LNDRILNADYADGADYEDETQKVLPVIRTIRVIRVQNAGAWRLLNSKSLTTNLLANLRLGPKPCYNRWF